jgi:diadenosine tetraphosphate (Ap4A) HIT family hydrolase
LICEQILEARNFAGGPLIENPRILAYHLAPNERFPRQYLGRVQVVTQRHVDHLSDLTEAEVVAVALGGHRIARALRAMEGVSRVHAALIGQHHPHFHLNLFPRYEWMPIEADWNALHRRDDAPMGERREIEEFIAKLRPFVPR